MKSIDLTMDTQEPHLKRCLELDKEALCKGNPPAGPAIMHDGSIIDKGHLVKRAAPFMKLFQGQQQ